MQLESWSQLQDTEVDSIWSSENFKVVDISQDIERPRKTVPTNQALEKTLDEAVQSFKFLGYKASTTIAARQ